MALNLAENYLSLRDASRLVPGNPHRNTLQRWMTSGVGGIRLNSVRIAGKRFTTRESIQQFLDALAQCDPLENQPAPTSAHAAAERRLDELGV